MLTATLTVAAASFALQGTALAGVTVGVNVGVPSFYYGAGYYPPGPCDAYSYYYEGDCGYPVYSGRVFVNGVWVPLDATLGEAGIAAEHIKFADSSFSETGAVAPLSAFVPLVGVLGKLQIDVRETGYKDR